jgi:hypothetical protein
VVVVTLLALLALLVVTLLAPLPLRRVLHLMDRSAAGCSRGLGIASRWRCWPLEYCW